MSEKSSRRQFLRTVGMSLGAGIVTLAAGCGSTPTPLPAPTQTARVVEKQVTQLVEKQVTQVVEKQVTQVVEKVVEKVVTPTVAAPIEIEFGQYDYPSAATAFQEIIKSFQAANPSIKVKYTAFTYEEYNEKIAALVPAGKGPDVAKPYYGWVPLWKDAGFISALPEAAFPPATFDKDFSSQCQSIKLDGKWWGMPLSVRTMGVFYHKDVYREAGITKVPTAWGGDPDEWLDTLLKVSKFDAKGKLTRSGVSLSAGNGMWPYIMMCKQAGGELLSPDNKKILWNASEAGYKAWQWICDMEIKHKISSPDAGVWCARTIVHEISHVGQIGRKFTDCPKDIDFGTFEVPAGPKGKGNMGTFWPLVMTTKATKNARIQEGAIKFLQYCGTRDPQVAWAAQTGELPALTKVANEPLFVQNPLMAPFIAQLGNSFSIFYVDEKAERDIFINAQAKITQKQDARKVLDEMVAELQKLRDAYFAKH